MERLLFLLTLSCTMLLPSAQGEFNFGESMYQAAESDGQLDVVVERSGDASGGVTVDINSGGSILFPIGDIPEFVSQITITFVAGQTSQVLSIGILDNSFDNPDIVDTLTLSNPSSGTIGPLGTTTVTILDDEEGTTPTWTSWGSYSQCSVSCGTGTQTRTRTCDDPNPFDSTTCVGNSQETDVCNTQTTCPQAAQPPFWSQWGQYTACTVTCGGGTQTRSRECIDQNQQDNLLCSQLQGSAQESINCNTHACLQNTVFFQHDSYTVAENVGTFIVGVERNLFGNSATVDITGAGVITLDADQITFPIGVNRIEIGIEVFDDDDPGPDISASLILSNPSGVTLGSPSVATILITDDDGQPTEPGVWSSWGEWSGCSVTCGAAGSETRTRRCTGSGQDCIGESIQSQNCDSQGQVPLTCPEWNSWGQWSECSLTCGDGSRMRTRNCNNFGTGLSCQGSNEEPGPCGDTCPELCKSDVEDTPYGHIRTPGNQPVGTTYVSEALCPWYTANEGSPIGRATCVNRNGATLWEWRVDCGGNKPTKDIIQVISDRIITPENADETLDDTMDATDNPTNIEPDDVSNVVDILKDVVNLELPDREITDKVVDIIDNLYQVNPDVLMEAQTMNPPTSEAVEAVEKQFGVVQIQREDIGDWPYRRVTNNVAAEVYEASNSDLCEGVYAATTSGPGVSSNMLLTRERQSSSDIDAEIEIPSEICNRYPGGARVILDVFVNDKLFPSAALETVNKAQNDYDRIDNSPVISVTVGDQEVVGLEQPVRLVFTPLEINANNTECVFWDTRLKDWSSQGCRYVGETPNWQRICECDHLTNFAVLMDVYGGTAVTKTQAFILEILSYVGCCLSIIGLVVTLITYCSSSKLKAKRPNQILMGLSSALLGLYVVFVILISIDTDREKAEVQVVACSVLAGILHYFTLASLCWMAVESYNMYLMFIKVINSYVPNLILKASVFAWGVPLIIVAVTAGAARGDYARTDFCFLQKWPLIGGVLIPIGLIIVFNIIIFVLVTVRLSRDSPGSKLKAKRKGLRVRRLRNAICIMTLMGLTWIIGYLSIIKAVSFFSQLLFCLLNAMQGYVIFMLYCVQQADVRNHWRGLCGTIRTGPRSSYFSASTSGSSARKVSSNRHSGRSADDAILINGNSAI